MSIPLPFTPAPRERRLLSTALVLVSSAALVVSLGALHLATTLLGLALSTPVPRARVTTAAPEARLDTAVDELAQRNARPLFVAPGLNPEALRLRIDAGSARGPLRETVRALDAYAATRGLWLHEVDGVLRLEREVAAVDLDCDDRLDACSARLERLASVDVVRDGVPPGRTVHLHLRRGMPALEAARGALAAAGFQVDVTGRTLSLSGGGGADVDASGRAFEAPRYGSIDRVGRRVYRVSRAAVEQALTHQGSLMRGTRIAPESRDGRIVGVRLFGLRPDEMPSRLGLQNGDVLLRVNGLEVATPERCLEAYSRLRQTDRVTLEIERAGRPFTLVYVIV